MSPYISVSLRRQVIFRAGNRCEYCHLAQDGQAAAFHIDHVVPVKSDGSTSLDNLALACVSCSLRKSAKETAVDPNSGELVPIFNPRQQNWQENFRWSGVLLIGVTQIGRVTVATLNLNRPVILAIREEEAYLGRHP
ncbi:Sll2007 protein [hydrothermal vent metagenome]|uniref:Sll2007 protein n=1 Tax=hydrothermal vent metagenome TaxID=652676 RepID=A0A3B0W646_9ZZZZ